MMKGSLVLVENNEKDFFPKAIKFFTGKIAKKYGVPSYTHAMFITLPFDNIISVQSAEFAQCIMPLEKFNTKTIRYDVYEIKDEIEEEELILLLKQMYLTAGNPYGFFQNLWFVYRYFAELIGFDVRKQKNWFPTHDICSEAVYRFLRKRVIKNIENRPKRNIYKYLLKLIDEWTENTVHPVDLGYIVKRFPNIFKKVYSWNALETR